MQDITTTKDTSDSQFSIGKFSNHFFLTIKGLALDDATAAKFIPVYKQYMEEMQATRHIEEVNMGEIGKK